MERHRFRDHVWHHPFHGAGGPGWQSVRVDPLPHHRYPGAHAEDGSGGHDLCHAGLHALGTDELLLHRLHAMQQ
ncbi:Uncharacterised protein [Bacteroides xylanisolvens]|nr:Uncharacterised protein [Bacteroides xylanisolvens]